MNENRDKVHLRRIIEAIERVDQYVAGYSFEDFAKDAKTLDSVLMQFINIGELANNLSPGFQEKHSDFAWHRPIGLRNEIVHGYFNIKPDIIWQTIKEDLPKLKEQIKKLL